MAVKVRILSPRAETQVGIFTQVNAHTCMLLADTSDVCRPLLSLKDYSPVN